MIYVRLHIYVCMYRRECMHMYIYTYIRVCVYICMYVCTCVCVRNISPKGRYMSAFIEGCMMQLASCLKHYLSSVA